MRSADIEPKPLFAGLSPDDLAQVATVTRPLRLDAGGDVSGETGVVFDDAGRAACWRGASVIVTSPTEAS